LGQGLLQLPRATPIKPTQSRLEVARGPGDLVEDRDRMAGGVRLRRCAADATWYARAPWVPRPHRRPIWAHGCRQTMAWWI